ncbi:MAG: hypothetical protein C4347_00090 [Patescibacteria group bacterium]
MLPLFVALGRAQQPPPSNADQNGARQRVPLTEAALDRDVAGQLVLTARLRAAQLSGTPDAPATNARVVIENRGPFFYGFASGWVTFYDAQGTRCGEAMWTINAFAPNESVERDLPGLRLTCTPATWRLAVTSLLTRTGDQARPAEQRPVATTLPLQINVNGTVLPIQLGNPIELTVGAERVRIVLNPAP